MGTRWPSLSGYLHGLLDFCTGISSTSEGREKGQIRPIAHASADGEVAPIPAVRGATIEPPESTQSGGSMMWFRMSQKGRLSGSGYQG
jgi:hypothetical protein